MSPLIPQARHEDAPSPQRPGVLSRGALLVLGSAALAFGVVGLLLPLIPSVPFFIAAGACFARAHRPLHDWMLRQRVLGPALRDWHRHRALPYWMKVSLVLATLVSFAMSIVLFAEPAWLKLTLGALALGIATCLWRIPARDRRATASPHDERR
jgi:uncharacterized membrane protein YbaN (DUF454 family)